MCNDTLDNDWRFLLPEERESMVYATLQGRFELSEDGRVFVRVSSPWMPRAYWIVSPNYDYPWESTLDAQWDPWCVVRHGVHEVRGVFSWHLPPEGQWEPVVSLEAALNVVKRDVESLIDILWDEVCASSRT